MESYGIEPNIWKNWSAWQKVTVLAFLKHAALLMTEPGAGPRRIVAERVSASAKGPGDILVARMAAQKVVDRLKAELGKLDYKVLWSIACTGATLGETAGWLFGDSQSDTRYAARRLHDALEIAALELRTTASDVAGAGAAAMVRSAGSTGERHRRAA